DSSVTKKNCNSLPNSFCKESINVKDLIQGTQVVLPKSRMIALPCRLPKLDNPRLWVTISISDSSGSFSPITKRSKDGCCAQALISPKKVNAILVILIFIFYRGFC